jgi:monoamine oxidase
MITRRNFITRVGQAGGFGAAYMTMQSLGLLPLPVAEASVVRLAEGSGKGTRVVVLGAGIAGLVAAWELRKAGYDCVILEARDRSGGRNWTIRKGTRVEMTDGTTQICDFADGHYFNAGPARLPSQHTTMLGYCRELGVTLEVEVNSSRSSLLQSDRLGQAVEQRQVINDTRGHVSELLAKAVNRNALEQELTQQDKERMLEFLRKYGDLSADYFYKGSRRSGYKVLPGAGSQAGTLRDPLDMHALLDANLWDNMLFEEMFDMQATMFQPVGGMDRIAAAFAKRLAVSIRHCSAVEQVRKTATGVRVAYRNCRTGSAHTLDADYCICALPLSILKTLDVDFSPALREAIHSASYDSAYKIAWESKRFWEQEYNIYGGISFLQQLVSVVWYPSAGLSSEKGIIIAGYGVESRSDFGKLDLAQKLAASRQAIERLHPGHGKDLEKPVYVSWGHIPYNLGSWVSGPHSGDRPGYQRLIEPDGPIYLAGDHVTHLVAWQEGAALSAHRAVTLISRDVEARKAGNPSKLA